MEPTKIMVIDDHLDWLHNVRSRIQAVSDLRCIPLPSYKNVVRQAIRFAPAVIVFNGALEECYAPMRELKGNYLTKDIPMVVLTDEYDEDSKIKAYTYGCIDFIVDPKESDDLVDRLRSYGCLGLIDVKLKRLIREGSKVS